MAKDPTGNGDGETGEDDRNGDGHVEEFDESDAFDESDLVTITDEEGKEYECAILGILEHKDAEFALLAPVAQLAEDDGEEIEMFIFAYSVDEDGQQIFAFIDDDALYEEVKNEFATLVNQEE